MDCLDNEDFPRGGKNIAAASRKKRKRPDNFIITEKDRKQKKVKTGLESTFNNENMWQAALKLQGSLTYEKMQEGMLTLACVRHISSLALQLEFPGLTFGVVTLDHVSGAFTNKMSAQLKNNEGISEVTLKSIIKVGQLMPAKILSVVKTDKGHEVQASINPVDINSDKRHNYFKKGLTIWTNVVAELDHGYELTLGVNNCRVFLPFKNVVASVKYDVGEPLYCVIHKVETSNAATTLTVSTKPEHFNNIQAMDLVLDDVIPGMRVKFMVKEITSHGVKGYFFENCLGYIDKTQMFSKYNSKQLKEGSTVTAYVLFVESITKVTYLTLHQVEELPEPQIKLGKVISAKILSVASRGLYLQLDKDWTGFITNKRLINTLSTEAHLDVTDALRKKYPVGTFHDCRVLDYNYMQQLYICTFEKQIIKEQIFSVKDLELSQLVTVKIDKVVPSGLIVKAGHVQGFVPNMHISNAKYSENIKVKFSVGMSVNARVLNITTEDNVIFTLKQGLVHTEKCLVNVDDALPNTEHVGFVVQTKISGALVAFYGNIKGWISNKVLNSENSGQYIDPRDYFFIGQVVTVWILGIKQNKLQISLNAPNSVADKKINVGDNLDGVITMIHSNGIDVEVGSNKVEATIPTLHLSSNLLICSILQELYQPGEKIADLLCLNNTDLVPVMSRRESLAYKKSLLKMYKLHELRRGMMLRCSFEGNSELGIYVSAPIKDNSKKLFIARKIISENKPVTTFKQHQLILTKIQNVNCNSKEVELSVSADSAPYRNATNILDDLIETIEDLEYIYSLHDNRKSKLTEYKIGSRVKCKIDEISHNGNCSTSLVNGIIGVIPAHLKTGKCSVGSWIEGVILEHDFLRNCVVISARNNINQKINPKQDGLIQKSFNSSCIMKILLVTDFYIMGFLNDSQCNRQLVYLPLMPGENINTLNKQKMKVVICRRVRNKIVGLPKKSAGMDGDAEHKMKVTRKEKNLKVSENVIDSSVEIMETLETEANEYSDARIVPAYINNSGDVTGENPMSLSPNNVCNDSALSDAHFFFDIKKHNLEDESSSEDNESYIQQNKKKKSLSEKVEEMKKEEERISKTEMLLADSTMAPQTAEHYDRLLLANPNSSELWLQYISMHVAATELEKARTVGRRAIETINPTLIKEKFNVWNALLNLENMYGTKESFEKLFEEAVRCNNSLDIYLTVINMLVTSGKLLEMEEKIRKLKTKEKDNVKMWLEIGRVYYSLKKFKEARNIKEAALKSILDRKRQFDIIIRFGVMECQMGELEQGIANFETILNTYPTKLNVWFIYVDQLIRQQKFETARNVLERSVHQKFSAKTMKSLFQKFIKFEEKFGTSETFENVKRKAKEYISTLTI